MGRRLTDPVITPRTNQVMNRWGVVFMRNDDLNKTLDPNRTTLRYHVELMHEDASKGSSVRTALLMRDWPPAMQEAIRTLHNMIVQLAESQGLFNDGTDTDDIAP